MSEHKKPEKDKFSGVETTGHEWDGIKELNNPAPRWWLLVFVICIIWSIGYWIVYPAWPTISPCFKIPSRPKEGMSDTRVSLCVLRIPTRSVV